MGRPLIIISIHIGRLVIWFEEERTKKYNFPLSTNLVEKIIRKDPWIKAVMKNLLILISHPLPFPSLFFSVLGREESVFRIELIIWDAFSVRGHWFGIVDSRPLLSTVGINRSYRRKQTPRFFIKACGQCCSVERQLQSPMGDGDVKIARQARR